MTTAIFAILVGFAGLIWSADRFVAGAAGIAKGLGMAPIMIGLTIVSIGTSAPEIIVSINAALENSGALAVGNAIGSNLANIGLVLGVTALIAPIPIAKGLIKREIPLLLAATLAVIFFVNDNYLSMSDGVIFLLMLAAIFYYLVTSKSHQPDAEHEADVENIPDIDSKKAWLLFIIGLVLLIISSRILVWGAKDIAVSLGVSELIIGLTIVAVGTSLPELAATVASALKGHHDIAIGNVIGSNLFNLLAVMAMPALINPTALEPEVFNRDYLAMTAITLLLTALLCAHYFFTPDRAKQTASTSVGRIGRVEGGLLLLVYGAYYYLLFPMS
ncbi:calcium/sodium antiporter [Oceanicoccus sp. KOV_DT_Chl]|uniref:calcium/sodium antiporter n=1 Tax=Oceanicoccus sp. KOV_DT_Chl TaxID=1904639 RepID=UPI000C7DE197|nr:calcium/sodium antiporter [Oceanicoccus sp. KOV_DT_Chl]